MKRVTIYFNFKQLLKWIKIAKYVSKIYDKRGLWKYILWLQNEIELVALLKPKILFVQFWVEDDVITNLLSNRTKTRTKS